MTRQMPREFQQKNYIISLHLCAEHGRLPELVLMQGLGDHLVDGVEVASDRHVLARVLRPPPPPGAPLMPLPAVPVSERKHVILAVS